MSGWTRPEQVVPAAALGEVALRWRALAQRWPQVARVLDGGEAGLVPGEESVGVAPALVEAVEALPGVVLGAIVLDWPRGATQVWPELGENRFGYQPVWVDGREAVVVRVDRAGRATEVLHVRGDGGIGLEAGGVDVVAPDVLTWWTSLTSWAEMAVPGLVEELAGEVDDPEELSMVLEEALEDDFRRWLAASG